MFLLICLFAGMLSQAKELSQQFEREVSQLPPPPAVRQMEELLKEGSVWLICDLTRSPQPALAYWANPKLWEQLQTIGFDALYLRGLKQSIPSGNIRQRSGLGLDPVWGDAAAYATLTQLAQKHDLYLVGDLVRRSTAAGADFQAALTNRGDAPSLYQMVEISSSDWPLLPAIPEGASTANVPYLSLQALEKRGYVPQGSSPWIKQSLWNATGPVLGSDGKARRWIYLQANDAPLLSWLRASFASEQVAAADALLSRFLLGQQVLDIDGALPLNAKETLALWARKLGCYTVEETAGGIRELRTLSCDFAYDSLTRAALLHALLNEDAEILQLFYRILLKEEIQPMMLVHLLQPLDQFTCEWTEFIQNPRKKYRYQEEFISGDLLNQRLLKADVEKLGPKERVPFSTWAGLCASALGIQDYEQGKDKIVEAHLLLALFYAMQPGIFALSPSDLLGALPSPDSQTLDLLGCSPCPTLYAALPQQLQNPASFAGQLRTMLSARSQLQIAQATLVDVPAVPSSAIALLHRLPSGLFQLTAINFGTKRVQLEIQSDHLINSSALDLVSGVLKPKVFPSPVFQIRLEPLTGASVLFQKKYFPDAPTRE